MKFYSKDTTNRLGLYILRKGFIEVMQLSNKLSPSRLGKYMVDKISMLQILF